MRIPSENPACGIRRLLHGCRQLVCRIDHMKNRREARKSALVVNRAGYLTRSQTRRVMLNPKAKFPPSMPHTVPIEEMRPRPASDPNDYATGQIVREAV
jgi:hypothetical protein